MILKELDQELISNEFSKTLSNSKILISLTFLSFFQIFQFVLYVFHFKIIIQGWLIYLEATNFIILNNRLPLNLFFSFESTFVMAAFTSF